MRFFVKSITLTFLVVSISISCTNTTEQFERISLSYSKIDFTNEVHGDEEIDIMKNSFYHNGAGVMAADFDNDGLEDLYFTGSEVSSRLYKNMGKLQFKDITEASGLLNNKWSTGVTFADINGDGYNDIYVCTVGEGQPNLFYESQGVNADGVPIFKEKAAAYGIDTKKVSTQAAFFDYDKDNDLDLVVAVNSQIMNYRNQIIKDTTISEEQMTNEVLYRNNADGTFSNITKAAGLTKEGSSLGLAINDLNNDGWPDIYIANDFISSDLMYINNQDGTFTDKTNQYLKHTTFHGMGVDIADINEDGMMDITVLDMLPESESRRKQMQMPINYDLYEERNALGYNTQYVKNTLQLNQGENENGEQNFSEISCLTGTFSTDWSWAPLWADYNNDGKKDLYITNGYPKNIVDLDHSLGLSNRLTVGTQEAYDAYKIEKQNSMPPIIEHNYLYENIGNMKMVDISEKAGLNEPSISSGVAFADLDNDGDLELVMNNFEQEVFLYKNNSIEHQKEDNTANFIKINLDYKKNNPTGLGSTIKIHLKNKTQSYFHSYVRGYMSSMGETIHFGLGASKTIDSIEVIWPNNKRQILKNITANQSLSIKHLKTKESLHIKETSDFIFKDVTDSLNLKHLHQENTYTDYKNDPLLLKMYSKEGPGLAVGDINGDGLDDVFIGGAHKINSKFFIQGKGGFTQSIKLKDSIYEDMGALFFDVDMDKDLDLYITSGGSEFRANSKNYQDRLYLNDGNGNFSPSNNIPKITSSGGPVKGADYDKDGDIDLFVGGKVKMGEYPIAPRSYILTNEKGVLQDKTPKALQFPGMVSDAIWSDFDNDGWVDLILVGEWMKISMYRNHNGNLKPYEISGLEDTSGWWNSIAAGDFDNDGDIDYLAGNLGTNTIFEATPKEPLRLYAGDYDKNNKIDPVITYYNTNNEGERVETVLHNRDAMNDQIVGFKRRFRDYTTYSNASFREILTEKETQDATILEAKKLSSSYIENLGNGTFRISNLPWQCQIAPTNGILVQDLNSDGNLDFILTGNSYSNEPIYGRFDASLGVYMLGDGKGNFKAVEAIKTGLYLNGDQKSIVQLNAGRKIVFVIGFNSAETKALTYRSKRDIRSIPLTPLDCYAEITFKNGAKSKQEFYYGNSYLSQSSRKLHITPNMEKVVIYNSSGKSREIK